MSSCGAPAEPEVYELCSLEAVLKLYGGLELPDPTTVVVLRSWRRITIMQKEIPRMGFVCATRVMSWERGLGREMWTYQVEGNINGGRIGQVDHEREEDEKDPHSGGFDEDPQDGL